MEGIDFKELFEVETKERREQLSQIAIPFAVAIKVKEQGRIYTLEGTVTEKGVRGRGYHVELSSKSQDVVRYSGMFFDDFGSFINFHDGYQRYIDL